MISPLRALWLALGLMTRVPVPTVADASLEDCARATRFYPVSGALVAGIVLASIALATILVGRPGALVGFCAWALATGGLHMDGLCDSLDGWFCGGDARKRLAVMRDPRAGALGVVGVTHWVLLKAALLWACLERGNLVEGVWWAAVVARAPLALELWWGPAASPGEGMAGQLHPLVKGGDVLVATLTTGALLAPFFILAPDVWLRGLIGILLSAGISIATHLAWRSKIGGINGDILGSLVEFREGTVLLAFAMSLS